MNRVIIIGASGHARVIADIIKCSGDDVIGFLDDRDPSTFPGLKVLGRTSEVQKFIASGVLFIIGIGDNRTRKIMAERQHDLHYYTAIHPSAVIASDVVIGEGTVIMANAVVNTGSEIGSHCIINTSATVDHDNQLDDYVHLSPGVHLSGTVSIGNGSWLGTGAVVCNNVNICGSCVVGAGAVVIKDISEAGVYKGVPAKMSANITKILREGG